MTIAKRPKGAVAAGHRLTAEAAANILREGGTVFDAAIAGMWMACVVEPVLSSIGGGGFLMAREAGKSARLVDFFAHTPRRFRPVDEIEFEAVHANFGTATQEFHIGMGASATPGFVPGMFAIHEQFCQLPMNRLAEQAVEIARTGFEITPFQAFLLEVVSPIYKWSDSARALFAPNGTLPKSGETFRNPDLGDALDAIAREGLRIATEGEIAQAMMAEADAGCLQANDLATYQVETRAPLQADLEGNSLALNPPPSCGGTLIGDMMARISESASDDPAIVAYAKTITATDAKWRHAKCNINAFIGNTSSPDHRNSSRGTTHISIVDAEGNAAAITVSNGEGNGRIVPGCGFMLNNMLGEEDLNPGGLYKWRENLRLASMMAPTIATRSNQMVAALGSGGSNRIRSALFQVMCRLFREGLSVEDAINASRTHVEHGHLEFEMPAEEGDRNQLEAAFPEHRLWDEPNLFFGGTHLVRLDAEKGLEAAGDPRRGGVAILV